MSGESLAHTRLVEQLIDHVRVLHRPPGGLLILADHHSFGRDRPTSIDGFFPDLFASDVPATFEVIGEAKTGADLETERSIRQIRTFLSYLSIRPGSFFYLSVPYFMKARAGAVVAQIVRAENFKVAIGVVDGVS